MWTDAKGRDWSTAITVRSILRVKGMAGVDLMTAIDSNLLYRLADDPILLVNVLYAVCKPQADDRQVTDEAFGELLAGDTIDKAVDSLVQGLIDFFRPGRRQILTRIWETTKQVQEKQNSLTMQKLESTAIAEIMHRKMEEASQIIDRLLSEPGKSSGELQE